MTGVLMYFEQYRDTGFTIYLVKAKEIADKLNIESELKTTLRSKRRKTFECEETDLPI
jgi:predicted aspartyl protease